MRGGRLREVVTKNGSRLKELEVTVMRGGHLKMVVA
jgi:hypothetical protein